MATEVKNTTEIKDDRGVVVGAITIKHWEHMGETATEWLAVAYRRTTTQSRWFGSEDDARDFIQGPEIEVQAAAPEIQKCLF